MVEIVYVFEFPQNIKKTIETFPLPFPNFVFNFLIQPLDSVDNFFHNYL